MMVLRKGHKGKEKRTLCVRKADKLSGGCTEVVRVDIGEEKRKDEKKTYSMAMLLLVLSRWDAASSDESRRRSQSV
jgi:hypothetical protein